MIRLTAAFETTCRLPSACSATRAALDTESPGLNTNAVPVGLASSPGDTLTAPVVVAPTTVSVRASALTPLGGMPASPAAGTVRTSLATIGDAYPPVPLRVSSSRPLAGTNIPAEPGVAVSAIAAGSRLIDGRTLTSPEASTVSTASAAIR